MNGNETLMDLFRNPDTMHSLTMGQKLEGSLITMVMGLGITFSVLILIWIFIAIMGKVMGATQKKSKDEAPAAAKATPAAAAAQAETAPADEASDAGLVAVITAAIAAFEGDSADNLIVRKITRLPGESTPWASAANEARMATRKMY